jgi:hypothetical protein
MQKLILLSLIFASLNNFAQTPKAIKLTKGQTITGKQSTSVDMNFGMGTMKTDNNTEMKLKVIDENENNYTVTITMTKIKMSADGMGQSMTYDSENPDEKSAELGEKAAAKLNIPETYILDKYTGKLTPAKEEIAEESDGGMFAMPGNQNQGGMEAFLVIPANLKIGSNWSDSVTVNDLTTVKRYKWISADKDIATIQVTGSMAGSSEQEIQGSKMPMSIDFNYSETRTVNTKTGQIIKITNDGTMETTLESMGMKVSSNINTASEYFN